MKISRLNLRLVSISLLVLLFAQLAFSSIFIPQRANAAGSDYTPAQLAAAYNAGMALGNCSKDKGWENHLSADEVSNGELFMGNVNKTVGYVTDPNDDGSIKCNSGDDIKILFNAIGESPSKFIIDNNIYYYSNSAAEYEFNNAKMGEGDAGNKAASDAIRKAIADKYKFSFSGNMSDPMQYAALLAAFNKRCKGADAPDGTGLGVILVGDDGKIPDNKKWFTAKDGNGENDVIEVGYGIDNIGDDQKANCINIVKRMNAKAGAYSELLIANAADSNPNNDPTSANAGAGDTTPEDACSAQGGVLSWIMCPVITMIGGTLNWIDTQLTRLLEIDRSKYNDNENLYKAWSQFRNLGLTLLIAAMLVMVISTALGVSMFDAYTVKKAFPRMVASVIFMLLSWYVCVFLIDFSNVIGHGTLGLMTSPFGSKADSITNLFSASPGGTFLQFGGIGIAASAFAIKAAPGIIMSWVGTGLLIMAIAFIVLVARQMFVIVLILLSPLAILSWIFPGNDKLWKFWWESFSKLLLMFPLVMALIASGRIFASVMATTQDAGAEGGLLNPLLKLTAYILPYAFIPFTFKAAGGVFGNLVGMANDRSRGAFDRLKKGRQKGYGEIGRNMKAGQGFHGNSTNAFNRLSSGVASGPRGWVSASKRRESRATGMALAGADQLKNNKTVQAFQNDDAFWLAMADESMAKEKIDKLNSKLATTDTSTAEGAAAAAKIRQEMATRQLALDAARNVPNKTLATRRAAALELSKTGYQFAQGEEGYAELARIAEAVSGGDAGFEGAFMNTAQYNLKGAGRSDIGNINHGAGQGRDGVKAGFRKVASPQRAAGKTDQYYAAASAWMGDAAMERDAEGNLTGKTVGGTNRDMNGNIDGATDLASAVYASVESGDTDFNQLSELHASLLADRVYASDTNKLEIDKQLQAIKLVSQTAGPSTRYTPEQQEQFRAALGHNEQTVRAVTDPSLLGDAGGPTPPAPVDPAAP